MLVQQRFFKAFVEFLGTFIFLFVILSFKDVQFGGIIIGLTLAACIMFASNTSGGSFNPAVNVSLLLDKAIDVSDFFIFTCVQVVAAVTAFYLYKSSNNVFASVDK